MESTKFNLGYMIFLSFVAAIGGLLFGYDTAVISGTIAQVTALFTWMRCSKAGMSVAH